MNEESKLTIGDIEEFDCSFAISIFLRITRAFYRNTMITSRRYIERELGHSNISDLMVDLLKIYYWHHLVKDSKEYWTNEVYLLYHDIPKTTALNFPDKKFIHECIWETNGDCFDGMEYALTDRNYDKLPRVHVEQDAIDFCEDYIWWLAEQLSTKGKVDEEEVKKEIDDLLVKYNR